MFLIFLQGAKITSIGLKLDRSQLLYWSLFLERSRLRSKDLMLLQAYLYLWIMTVFMIQFENLPVLLILSDAGSNSSSCRIWIMQAPALVDLRRRGFIMIKLSRTFCHMHWHTNNSQNFVKYMRCSAVVISSAFESNHIADMSLQSC